ncbi:MAG: hypothetical protein MUD08_19355 [Cytophagales bacterium]|nr:hypothetical protein [Cytophagales bacterium]
MKQNVHPKNENILFAVGPTATGRTIGLFGRELAAQGAREFLNKLDASLSVIVAQPEAFPASRKMPGLRRCVVTPQTILYYRIRQNEIEVIALSDARQER